MIFLEAAKVTLVKPICVWPVITEHHRPDGFALRISLSPTSGEVQDEGPQGWFPLRSVSWARTCLLPLHVVIPFSLCVPGVSSSSYRDTRHHWMRAHSDGLILLHHLHNDYCLPIRSRSEVPGIGESQLACDIEERGHVTWLGVEDRGM